MLNLDSRRKSLGMTPETLARRAKLSRAAVHAVLTVSAGATDSAVQTVRSCLGVRADGSRLVPVRTLRKHFARKKARFIVSMVQGTMGLEAQGLRAEDRVQLFEKTYRHIRANPADLW